MQLTNVSVSIPCIYMRTPVGAKALHLQPVQLDVGLLPVQGRPAARQLLRMQQRKYSFVSKVYMYSM